MTCKDKALTEVGLYLRQMIFISLNYLYTCPSGEGQSLWQTD